MNSIFDVAAQRVQKIIPDFSVRYKDENTSSKIIAALVWIFNRTYMEHYTTTRYPNVYFPSREFVASNPKRAAKILAHEFIHLWDRQNNGVWFTLSYLLPQLLVLIMLPATIAVGFFLPWWVTLICAVLTALCASPLPAYWRMRWELRGYTMSIAVNYWCYGSVQPATIKWVVKCFTGWDYYKMWPFEKAMHRRIKAQLRQ